MSRNNTQLDRRIANPILESVLDVLNVGAASRRGYVRAQVFRRNFLLRAGLHVVQEIESIVRCELILRVFEQLAGIYIVR